MKTTSCLICQNSASDILLVNTNDPFGALVGSNETRYVICDACGFVYQNPTLEAPEIDFGLWLLEMFRVDCASSRKKRMPNNSTYEIRPKIFAL